MAAQEEFEAQVVKAYEAEMAKARCDDELDGIRALDEVMEAEMNKAQLPRAIPADGAPETGKQPRNRKRPRDRILRDLTIASDAMELRKRGAFMGYTYRRPREILASLEEIPKHVGLVCDRRQTGP